MRQLARLAGVSNPYLSQIERGLRKPSAEILQQIAKGLQISAEQLYLRAGILEYREGNQELVAAILTDEDLSERQKQVLLDIYESFRRAEKLSAAPVPPLAPADEADPHPRFEQATLSTPTQSQLHRRRRSMSVAASGLRRHRRAPRASRLSTRPSTRP